MTVDLVPSFVSMSIHVQVFPREKTKAWELPDDVPEEEKGAASGR